VTPVILHRDAHVVAVDKPSGLFVHKSDLDRTQPALLQHVRDAVGTRVWAVHRLDRPVSGIVLFALSRDCAGRFSTALAAATKTYLALVRGETPPSLTMDRALTHPETKRRQPCVTELETIATYERCSFVRLRIETGRRHQIRRHLAHAAHHVLGDTRYGKGRINRDFRERYGLTRIALHASRLELVHPMTGAPLRIEAPLPDVMQRCLDALSAPAPSEPTGGQGRSIHAQASSMSEPR
jgi:tRNA pseudouridine65 synthase